MIYMLIDALFKVVEPDIFNVLLIDVVLFNVVVPLTFIVVVSFNVAESDIFKDDIHVVAPFNLMSLKR
jgi:hypothetical protein